ncbi:MAG: TIGR01212 family radical SAM protein, partial [Chitinispirillia bacterium]
MQNHYLTYRNYLKNRFGKAVQIIPVNGGFSCPNRDGTKSFAGCTFCDNRSFSPVALKPKSISHQLSEVIKNNTSKNKIFLAYLQPFSNTYGSVNQLKRVYEPILGVTGIKGLIIGTRPDCLSE